ncbi:cation:proton antiporter domain-containing protein [Terrisporobacter sp.]
MIVGIFLGPSVLKVIDISQLISILSVIIAYEFSTYSGGSGYMSCFIVSLVTGNKQNFKLWLSQKHYDTDCSVAETLGTICRMCIFIILGSQVQLDVLFKYLGPALVCVLGLTFIVRPICVLACTLVDRKAKWNKNQLFL